MLDLLTIKKIPDFIEVYFKIRDFYMKLKILVHCVNMVENIIDDPRNDTAEIVVMKNSLAP